jgi:signal transduction histidine kinase
VTRPDRAGAAVTKRTLWLAFLCVVAVGFAAQAVRFVTARSINRSADRIYHSSLSGIRILERFGVGIERWRILINGHILESRLASMEERDRQVAKQQAANDETARQYEALALDPDEREVWARLRSRLDEVETAVEPILADSRRNRDAQARAGMLALEPKLDAIESDVDELVAIDQAGAADATARIHGAQRDGLLISAGLSALAALVVLTIASVVIPLVGRRQEEAERHAGELESRNRELDAFAGRVAHDLRGPLTAINLSAARLSDRMPQSEGATTVFQRGVRRMEALIEDLLSLSRIDAQLPGRASTSEVAQGLESDLSGQVAALGGELRVEVEKARVRCSEGLLRQVLWNLGDNAVKYRREGVPPRIEILGRVAAGQYEFRVSDNGCGMSSEESRRAFEPFYRGTRSRDTQGTGLGLSIVKRVVEAAGGTFGVESRFGEGSTFRVTLPIDGATA